MCEEISYWSEEEVPCAYSSANNFSILFVAITCIQHLCRVLLGAGVVLSLFLSQLLQLILQRWFFFCCLQACLLLYISGQQHKHIALKRLAEISSSSHQFPDCIEGDCSKMSGTLFNRYMMWDGSIVIRHRVSG